MFSFLWPSLQSNALSLKLSFIQLTFSLCPCEQTTNSLDCIVPNSSLGVEVEPWWLFLWNTLVSYLTNLPPRYKYLLYPYQKMCLPWSIKESCNKFCKKDNCDEDVIFPWLLPLSSMRRIFLEFVIVTFLDPAGAGQWPRRDVKAEFVV